MPPFVIFWDSVLLEITAALPRDEEQLLAVKGVGKRKLAKYGAQFINAIEQYCREQNA